MKEKLLKFNKMDFVPARWNGKNESGYRPIGDRVIIAIDRASSVSMGGINIPAEVAERLSMAAETGVLVESGEGAFLWNSDGTKFVGTKPQPGDRVFVERYAGQIVNGPDGNPYRIMDYKSLGAIQVKEKVNV